MCEVNLLIDVGNGREVRRGDVHLLELLHVCIERGLAGEVVVHALVVDRRVVAEANERRAALLARRLHKARGSQVLEVVQPLECLGDMGDRHGRDVAADRDDVLIAHVENLLEGVVKVIVERGALVGDVVDFHWPLAERVVGLAHELDVVGRRSRHEEIVGNLVNRRVLGNKGIVVRLHRQKRLHAHLAHVVQTTTEQLRRLLGAQKAATLNRQARLHQARDGRLAEQEQRLLFLCHNTLLRISLARIRAHSPLVHLAHYRTRTAIWRCPCLHRQHLPCRNHAAKKGLHQPS